jgi:hypothetical protein
MAAVAAEDELIVQLLIDRGAKIGAQPNPDMYGFVDGGGRTPLQWAAFRGSEALVKLLLARGADVNQFTLLGAALAQVTGGEQTGGSWEREATNDLLRGKIKIRSVNFMRGRTFINRYVIIDEAQNLTAKQMKTLVTRAGPGTKVVCLGNIAQIDTPYLTETTSGLTYVVDRFKHWEHSGHITLQRGERSRLADHASEVL